VGGTTLSASPLLEVDRLRASWDGVEVLRGVSLDVADGEVLTLLGPNGSGKTTLLRVLAGFERPTGGSVRLGGRDLADVPPHRRSIGLLFQEPALFPRRSVLENIAYAPLLQRRPDTEVRARVREVSGLLGLDRLLDRRPDQLSGGERQRVALARTLAARPRLVLLDEPFASVDVEIRAELHAEFRTALRAFGAAAIHVTHDREEGLFFGDRLALIFDGTLDEVGPPRQLFAHPTSERSARFLGYNILRGPDGTHAVLPDDLIATAAPTDGPRYVVKAAGPTGRRSLAVLEGPHGERIELRSDEPLEVGSAVGVRWTRAVALPPSGPASAASRGPPSLPSSAP
jgi:ABC-type Fe3+/spermidine/putrescine transport system ATPase subunit